MRKTMKIKEFIEAAIEGGWKFQNKETTFNGITEGLLIIGTNYGSYLYLMHPAELLTYPEAWKAVGKVNGWVIPFKQPVSTFEVMKRALENKKDYTMYMHDMVTALCNGKTLKEYIATLQ